MIAFLMDHGATILICVSLAAVIGVTIWRAVKHKGNCDRCASCGHCTACSKGKPESGTAVPAPTDREEARQRYLTAARIGVIVRKTEDIHAKTLMETVDCRETHSEPERVEARRD